MLVADFDFHLPDELIAQAPPATRGTSRLMVLDRATGKTTISTAAELPGWLRPGDVLDPLDLVAWLEDQGYQRFQSNGMKYRGIGLKA